MSPTPKSLWRNADFLKLWAGQTISLIGSEVTGLALPLTAALTLNATPAQMGILGAVQYAPRSCSASSLASGSIACGGVPSSSSPT